MQKLILILTILLMSCLAPAKGQTNFETQMTNALDVYQKAQNVEDFQNLAKTFDLISASDKTNWLPVYYSMLSNTMAAFRMNPKAAIQVSDDLEKQYDQLLELNPNEAEVLILRALFRTVKLAKDPMSYSMVLPSAIIADYNEALKLEPENPRATYLIGQFNMESAPYNGTDPLQYCPTIEKAKSLFQKQKRKGFEPFWGEDNTDEILDNQCKK